MTEGTFPIIGIIGALPEEVEMYHADLAGASSAQYADRMFYAGRLGAQSVVVATCGVGKVHAALCTQILLDRFQADAVLFTGVAGALNPALDILDLVISRDTIQHDMDATGLGFPIGAIPYTDLRFFTADPRLVARAEQAASARGLRSLTGRVLTGDQFVADRARTQALRSELGGDCVDMESAAVAQVCVIHRKPFVCIRAISDRADHGAPVDFNAFCSQAARQSHSVVRRMLA